MNETVRSLLLDKAESIQIWAPFDEVVAKGVGDLLVLLDADEELAGSFYSKFGQVPIAPSENGIATDVWVRSLKLLRQSLNERWPSVIASPLQIQCDGPQWIELCHTLDADPVFTDEVLALFKPSVDINEIVEYLGNAILEKSWGRNEEAVKRISTATLGITDWDELLSYIVSALDETETLQEASDWIETARRIGSEASVVGMLENVTESGMLLSLLQKAQEAKDAVAVANFFTLSLIVPNVKVSPEWTEEASSGLAYRTQILQGTADKDVVESILSRLIELGWGDIPFSLVSTLPASRPFLHLLTGAALNSKTPWGLFPPKRFINQLPLLQEVDNNASSFDRIVSNMCLATDLFEEAKKSPFDLRLFDAIAAAVGFQDTQFRTLCMNGLTQTTKTDWTGFFQEKQYSRPSELNRKLLATGAIPSLSQGFLDAFVEYALAIASGTTTRNIALSEIEALRSQLSSDQRVEVARRVVAILAGKSAPETFYKRFSNEIADIEVISEQSNIVESTFIRIIQERNNTTALEWLYHLAESNPSYFRLSNTKGLKRLFSKESISEFRATLGRVAGYSGSSKNLEVIRSIAKAIDVKPEKKRLSLRPTRLRKR